MSLFALPRPGLKQVLYNRINGCYVRKRPGDLVLLHDSHWPDHLVDLSRVHLLLHVEDIGKFVLRVRPQLPEYGLGLLFLVVALVKGIFQANFFLHFLVVLTHLIEHLLDNILAVWVCR